MNNGYQTFDQSNAIVKTALFFKQKCLQEIIIVTFGFNNYALGKIISVEKSDTIRPYYICRLWRSSGQNKVTNDELFLAAQPWVIQSKYRKDRINFLFTKLIQRYPQFQCHVFGASNDFDYPGMSEVYNQKAFVNFNRFKNEAYGATVLIILT